MVVTSPMMLFSNDGMAKGFMDGEMMQLILEYLINIANQIY